MEVESLITLEKLTGLSNQDLADVFAKNPRAYMAVKGAVAEKHLEILLDSYKSSGVIADYRGASGDFDKDFYITLPDGREVSLECKNIQVLDTKKKNTFMAYIQFLVSSSYLQENWLVQTFQAMAQEGVIIETETAVDSLTSLLEVMLSEKTKVSTNFYKFFPQHLRESGVPRYEFSASLVNECDVTSLDINDFINQFSHYPLSIDFQRTRNSTDEDGDTKKQRFYRVDEIDIVGACLFSRTMKWQFIFGHSRHFDIHKKYEDRYSNKFIIKEDSWSTSLVDCV